MMLVKKNKGFLLLELMVVVALVAFTSMLSMSYISLKPHSVKKDLLAIQSWLLSLQQQAMLEGKDVRVVIDTDNNRMACHDSAYCLNQGITFGFLKGAYGPPSSPVRQLQQPTTFENNQIVLCATGSVQPGTLYVIDTTGNAGALSCGISLNGLFRCYGAQGRVWKLIE